MQETRIIGRERELAQLGFAIGPGTDGLRIAMLSGPSGQGKSTLATAILEQSADDGFRVATIQGRAGSLSTPFAPFLDAMPEFEVLLEVISSSDSAVDVELAGIGIVNLIAELTTERPLLLAFDDAQALDESSIALLPYLSGISERTNLTLLFIEQTDAIGVPSSYRAFIDGVLSRRIVGHLELGPMSDEAIRLVVANELGLDDATAAPAEIILRSQGNPWFAKELAVAWQRGIHEIPTNIAAAATARLHALDELGQDLVNAVALCAEGAHVGWLEALSEQRPRQFVRTMDGLLQSGLVREDGDIITIAHPLMQQSLIGDMSAAMRRAIHLELAEIVSTMPLSEIVAARARGFHLASAGRAPEAVAEYVRAADANEVIGQIHEAYADCVHALDAETRSDERIDLLRRCASLAIQVDRVRAEQYWVELGRIAAARGDDETYSYALFQQYWTCNDGNARDRLERAAKLGTDSNGWASRAAANIASLDGDFERAVELDRGALAIARERGDFTLAALATHRLGVSLALMGSGDEAIEMLREAVAASIQHRLHGWAVTAWGDLAEMLSLALRGDEALSEARAAVKYVEDLGLDRMRATALAWRASAELRHGDVDVARETITLAATAGSGWSSDQFTPLVACIRAEVAIEANDSAAMQYVGDAANLVDELGYTSWSDMVELLRIRASVRGGSLGDALQCTRTLVETTTETALRAEALIWLSRTAILLDDTPTLDSIGTLREFLSTDVPYVDLAMRELDAIQAARASSDVSELSIICNEWTEHGRILDGVRLTAVIGAIHHRAGRSKDAKELLHASKTALSNCGASADADLVASLLRQTGARSRAKSRTTNVGPLTKRELEIARLVASGLKNSEVASTLFLAEKTVAAHLSNIYGKVEVKSRVQLTAWIRENDAEFEASLASA